MKMVLRYTLLALTAGALATPLAAQHDPDHAVAGDGSLPAGWNARPDRNAPLTNVKFAGMGTGFHATLGPAAIFWRAADTASGNVHIVATFAQTKLPTHPEAYGLIFGGRNLGDSTQSYTYFVVRATADKAEFLIRQRNGATTSDIAPWTASDALNKADATGKASNELSVQTGGGKVRFFANGKEVHSVDAGTLNANGIVGYRVNHNLDVHLSALGIHKM